MTAGTGAAACAAGTAATPVQQASHPEVMLHMSCNRACRTVTVSHQVISKAAGHEPTCHPHCQISGHANLSRHTISFRHYSKGLADNSTCQHMQTAILKHCFEQQVIRITEKSKELHSQCLAGCCSKKAEQENQQQLQPQRAACSSFNNTRLASL